MMVLVVIFRALSTIYGYQLTLRVLRVKPPLPRTMHNDDVIDTVQQNGNVLLVDDNALDNNGL
jgi:hypothetical protein